MARKNIALKFDYFAPNLSFEFRKSLFLWETSFWNQPLCQMKAWNTREHRLTECTQNTNTFRPIVANLVSCTFVRKCFKACAPSWSYRTDSWNANYGTKHEKPIHNNETQSTRYMGRVLATYFNIFWTFLTVPCVLRCHLLHPPLLHQHPHLTRAPI